MCSLNWSDYGFFEKESISRTWFSVPNEYHQSLFNLTPVRHTLYSTRSALIHTAIFQWKMHSREDYR